MATVEPTRTVCGRGHKVPVGDRFCPVCGSAVGPEVEAAWRSSRTRRTRRWGAFAAVFVVLAVPAWIVVARRIDRADTITIRKDSFCEITGNISRTARDPVREHLDTADAGALTGWAGSWADQASPLDWSLELWASEQSRADAATLAAAYDSRYRVLEYVDFDGSRLSEGQIEQINHLPPAAAEAGRRLQKVVRRACRADFAYE